MSLVDNIIEHLKLHKTEKDSAPKEICPNCWGRQEYGGNFYQAIKVKGFNIDKIDDQRGWVQDYTDKYLTPIKLTSLGDYTVCPRCSTEYRTT